MTTNQQPRAGDGLIGILRLLVLLWLGWIALVLFHALWIEVPVLAAVLVVGALYALWVRYSRKQKRIMAQHVAYNNAKAERHRRDRVERALRHPDLVWEDNVDLWDRELRE